MYSDWVGSVPYGAGLLAIFIWLGALSFFIWQQSKFLKSLFPKSGERDARKKFEEIVKAVESFKKDLSDLNSKVTEIQSQGLQHIQRVRLMRFNPFDDTGGDQSFVVALLNDKGSGIVINSLHTRSGTRVFAKDISLGKSIKYQLSKEEELVIKEAMER